MLYTMRDLLKVARENQFAVPAFNISSFDMLKSIMEEVEAQNAPVIMEIHPDEIAYLLSLIHISREAISALARRTCIMRKKALTQARLPLTCSRMQA